MLVDTNGSAYRVGQVWSYKTRANEPWSTLTIVKVESHAKFGNIVHVSLDGLKMKGPEGLSAVVYHLPFSEKALQASETQLRSEGSPVPNFRPGYERWRKAIDQGKAGVWSMPIAQCLDAIEKASGV